MSEPRCYKGGAVQQPPAPPPPPSQMTAAASADVQKQQERRNRAKGYASTVLTGGMGVPDAVPGTKTILGG